MSTPNLADRVGNLIQTATHLCHDIIRHGATTPDSIAALLDQLAPQLVSEERQAVLRMAAWSAASLARIIDEVMLSSLDAAQWTHAIAAYALEYRWAGFDLRVCLGDHPDDADKGQLRDEEVEYFRPSLHGMYWNAYGQLFQKQLAQVPTSDHDD